MTQHRSCWFSLGQIVGFLHAAALLISLITTGVLNFSRCPLENGRVCNGVGSCVDGQCVCEHAFFSGQACGDTYAPGYIALTGQVCSGHGILGAPLVNKSHIPDACKEDPPSALNGYRRSGGWKSEECYAEIQSRLSRLVTSSANLTADDVFSLPLCSCFPPYTGPACDTIGCPFDTTLETCSGHGNRSVTYTNNATRSGDGCQCKSDIVRLLHPTLQYSRTGYFGLRDLSVPLRLFQAQCGRLIEHPTNPDLKMVLTSTESDLYSCHCDDFHFGPACEFGVCPENANGTICSGHGSRNVGIGYEKNTTRNDPQCQPVCTAPGTVLCDGECKASSSLCGVKDKCPASAPVRCRDGTCVPRPLRDQAVFDYSFGFDESALAVPKKQCYPTEYSNSSAYLTPEDYTTLLTACAGDESTVDTVGEPLFVPGGKIWFDSSLVSALLECSASSNNVTLTLRYRGQTVALTCTPNAIKVATFSETYEEKLQRILRFTTTQVTITPAEGEVELYPVPFIHDVSTDLPTTQVIYIRSSLTSKVVRIQPTGTRIFVHDEGLWFIANITDSRVVIPGGNIISLQDCYAELASCVWNVETRLSYDGTRKLCGSRTSSTNMQCTTANPLPSGYIRLDTVLVGTIDDPALDSTYDWSSQGPWVFGQTTGPASDVDFSFDGDWLFLDNPSQLVKLRRIEFVQLQDIIIPNACPPSKVNASTLDTKWFQQSGRRVAGLAVGKSYAVGSILHPTVGLKMVRGLVVGDLLLSVRGYSDPVPVMDWREITSAEFQRGVQYEDVHVFPALCPDGGPSKIQAVSFNNITVKCECDMTGANRTMNCQCRDHLLGKYTCTCPSTSSSCSCSSPTVGADWLFDVEQSLQQQREVEDLGYCYFYDSSPLITRTGSFRVNTTVDEYGAAQMKRVEHSALLLEVHIPCNDSTTHAEWYQLFGRVGLYEDDFETVPTTVSTECIGNLTTIKPLFSTEFGDTYDEWILIGASPNSSVEFLFAPGGIPISNISLEVSSNDDEKQNMLWNDLTHWRSNETDFLPTVTVSLLDGKRMVVGIYVVFETVGLYVADFNMSIPSQVLVQGSLDGGVSWYVLGTFNSSVYHGQDDLFLPIHDKELTHVRLTSSFQLGISTLLVLTNQQCSQPDTVLYAATDDVTSLEVVALADYAYTGLNSSAQCICLDTCSIGGSRAGPTDTCADVLYKRTLLPEFAWVESLTMTPEQIITSFASPNSTIIRYLGFDNTTYWWWWSSNVSDVVPSMPTDPLPTNTSVDTFRAFPSSAFVYYAVNSTNVTVSTDGTLTRWQYKSLVERGLACGPGTHCSACGPSNRIDPSPLPGATCQISAYKQRILNDIANRTDHFITRSSFVTDYLATEGRFSVHKRYVFYRQSVRLSRGPCQDCDGLFRCTTGECVSNLRDCPAIRYNCPGNGCTRVSVLDKKYTCACDVGWGGKDCSEEYCVPGDTYTGNTNPFLWCSCGQFPPIKAKPPYVITGHALTTAQLIRSWGSFSLIRPGDYENYPFFPSFASFGESVLRTYQAEGGRTIYTTCWFYKRGPFGQPISFFDSAIIDPHTLKVIGWRAWDTASSLNGDPSATVTYGWGTLDVPNPARYDEFPYRCGHGSCVAKEEDCYNDKLARPPCGDHGKCRVDGTCDCFTGSKTFVYTNEWTNKALIPYDSENPTNWGKVAAPLKPGQHCQARDCANGQCEIPMGCFPGSKGAKFQDAHVACSADSGHFGMCGVDQIACRHGNVTAPGPCSFLGVPRQRDYRPEEWYCECGDLQTKLAKLSDSPTSSKHREVTELKKNGWGGPVCQYYFCQESSTRLIYTFRDERTSMPYKDHEQYVLPGKWTGGSCGAPIGPSPDDIVPWVACCPNVPFTSWGFARCTNVMCQIGNVPSCVTIAECSGPNRSPMVYPCHGKGRPRADGTCECDQDQASGQGYGPDESGVGCYRRIQCPVAKSNGQACKYGATDVAHWTELPKVPYWESQIPVLLLREGKIPTPENLVKRLTTNPDDQKNMALMAASQTALGVLKSAQALQGCIYIKNASDTDCAHPFGMVPYCDRVQSVGYYMKGYLSPHQVMPNATYGANATIFYDRKYQQYQVEFSQQPEAGKEYVELTEGQFVVFTFAKPTLVSVIKLYALALNSSYAGGAELAFFSNDTLLEVCGNLVIPRTADNRWRWGGTNEAHYCERLWQAYQFNQLSTDYIVNCDGKEFSSTCVAWQSAICTTVSGAVVRTVDAFNEYPGCPNTAVCCQPLSPPRTPTSSVVMLVRRGRVGLQEIAFLGSTGTVETIPASLEAELRYWFSGSAVGPDGGCLDYPFISSELGSDLEFHVWKNYTAAGIKVPANLGYDAALAGCEGQGGLLAESRGNEQIINYAKDAGSACFVIGGTPPDGKCLVAAKNRNEMPRPNTVDFFKPSCSQWGCYMCNDGTEQCIDPYKSPQTDIVAVPDATGAMYQTAWFPGIKKWTDVINAWYAEEQRQTHMYGIDWVTQCNDAFHLQLTSAETTFLSNVGPWIRFSTKIGVWNDTGNFRYMGPRYSISNGLYSNVPWPYNPPWVTYSATRDVAPGLFSHLYTNQPSIRNVSHTFGTRFGQKISTFEWTPQTVPSQGGFARVWTNPQTCRVSVYTKQWCGMYWLEVDGQSKTDTPAKHYFASPYDDYSIFGRELLYILDGTFETVTMMGDSASRYTQCVFPGGAIENQFISVAVEGPCFAVLVHNEGDGNRTAVFEENNKRETHPYESKFNWYYNGYDYGCWPQCWEDLCANDQRVRSENVHRGGYTEGSFNGYQKSLKIFPKFDNYMVQYNLRAEKTEINKGSDEFTIGRETHPYMCSRMQMDVIQGFTASTATDSATFDTIQPKKGLLSTTESYIYTGSNLIPSHESVKQAYLNGIAPPEFQRCSLANRTILPCTQCPVTQPKGQWEWDQRHYEPNKVMFNVGVGAMNQVSMTKLPETPVPQIHAHVTFANKAPVQFYKLMDLLTNKEIRAFSRLVANLSVPLDYRRKFFLDDCVAVVKNSSASAVITYSYQPVVCEPKPEHRALCMRDWTKYAVQPGRMGDKCGSSCRSGPTPSEKNAYDENELASPEKHPIEHRIYQAWLAGTLDTLYAEGEVDWKLVYDFMRYTLNESLVWSFEEARDFLLDSMSTRPGRSTLGAIEDPREWLDFDWRQTWPVDCGERCSKETGICRPMRAVDQKYCDADHRQFDKVAYVPETQLPLDVLPVPIGTPTVGLKRCSVVIDPSTYARTTVNGPPSPTNRDFVVLEEVPGQYVILRATKNGINSWHNTGKSDHGYIFGNDSSLYGTFACTPSCPEVSVWVSPLSVTYGTTDKLLLGSFTVSPYLTAATEAAVGYRTVGYDFYNLTRQTVIKLSISLAQDNSTIADCQRPLDELHEEPPASIVLPSSHSECVFEYDAFDDRKVPGQCFCSDVSWGGETCESPSLVTFLRGKQVCGSWGRPNYMATPNGTTLVPVDEDGVWFLSDGTAGCTCLNPGLIIRTRLQLSTRFAYPSIFLSERILTDSDFVDLTPPSTSNELTFTEAETICASDSTDLPSYTSVDEVTTYYELATTGSSFVALERDFNTGTLRWTGGLVMFQCTNSSECGTQMSTGGVCAVSPDGCRTVHYNNLLLYSTGTALTDGRRDLTYPYSSGTILQFTPNTIDVSTPMRVELLFADAPGLSTLINLANGTLCTAPTVPGVPLRSVYDCPAMVTFNVSFVGNAPVIEEVYAYKGGDKTRLYDYH